MTGWIKLHRQIMEHWIWEDAERFKWWMEIILLTNHTDKKTVIGGEVVTIKRGTFHTSELKLSNSWGVSRSRVRRFLKLLEDDGMISTKKTANGTTIKVHNYGVYQGKDDEKKQPTIQQSNNKRTTDDTTDEQPTIQQSNNGRYKTKNVKNYKNEKNVKNDKKQPSSFSFFQDNGFGVLQPFIAEQMTSWIADFGEYGDDIVIRALEEALSNNVTNWKYVNGILKNWYQKGYRSVDDIEADANMHTTDGFDNSQYRDLF